VVNYPINGFSSWFAEETSLEKIRDVTTQEVSFV
jgi:hypothetical protein